MRMMSIRIGSTPSRKAQETTVGSSRAQPRRSGRIAPHRRPPPSHQEGEIRAPGPLQHRFALEGGVAALGGLVDRPWARAVLQFPRRPPVPWLNPNAAANPEMRASPTPAITSTIAFIIVIVIVGVIASKEHGGARLCFILQMEYHKIHANMSVHILAQTQT